MKRTLVQLLVILAGATTAAANDWYVDPVFGNDANSGTWAWDAWRTLAWTQDHVPFGAAETIHLAPGTYVETTTFFMRPQWRLVGEGGSAVTILQHDAVSAGMLFLSQTAPFPNGYGPDSEVRGLTISAPNGNAIEMVTAFGPMSPTLVDVRITSAKTGLLYKHNPSAFGASSPTFDRVRISTCIDGLLYSATSASSTHTPRMLDCEVSACTNRGLFVEGFNVALDAKRCRFLANTNASAWFESSSNSFGGVFEDCLFAQNSGAGVLASKVVGIPTSIDVTLRRCTVADNAGFGIRESAAPQLTTLFRLESTIVARNGDDLSIPPSAIVSYCCIEDGDFAGTNGNFAADPAFVDAPAGDYRLRWASACAETGDPATPAGSVDLAGHVRPIDGNLDIVEAPDIGAFELAPLDLFTTGQSGSVATFEFWGTQGTSSLLYYTRIAPVPPLVTAFGEFDLDPASAHNVLRTAVGSGPPTIVQRNIPNSPAWIGHTVAYQALTRSSIAPSYAAYTNAVQFTIVP